MKLVADGPFRFCAIEHVAGLYDEQNLGHHSMPYHNGNSNMKQPTSQISRHDTTVNNHIRDGIERIVKNEFFGADLRGADDRYRSTHRSTIQQDIRG